MEILTTNYHGKEVITHGKRQSAYRPRGDQWAVQREGADRASSLHSTQSASISAGRRIAQSERGELFIHGQNGQIVSVRPRMDRTLAAALWPPGNCGQSTRSGRNHIPQEEE